MKKNHFFVLMCLLSILLVRSETVFGQGCSDAGFCTIHSLKPLDDKNPTSKNYLNAGISYGKGEYSLKIVSPYIDYTRVISPSWNISGKLIFSSVNGDLGKTSGLSDIFISTNYAVSSQAGLTLGLKIPFNDGNTELNNLSLPMAYQTSLGTTDIIAGVNYSIREFQFVAAFQQPLAQNSNKFISNLYPTNSEAQNFPTTNNYKRSGDILLRLSYKFTAIKNKLEIIPGILPIFHLADDKYTNNAGVESSIIGSSGVTLNGNIFLDYIIDPKNLIELSFGAPLKSRSVRPDGLTRKFVAALEYKIRF